MLTAAYAHGAAAMTSAKCPKSTVFSTVDLQLYLLYKNHFKHVLAPGLSHITRRKVTSPNGNARWRKVTSQGGKSHHFLTIPMAQRHPTENQKVTKSSRDIAHSEIFVDFRRSLHRIPMAQRVLYSLFPNSQHPGSQWHSDYYTDFS